ncbi:MAG: HAD family hydrolase [Candidatus Dormibacteraceae bacterium]
MVFNDPGVERDDPVRVAHIPTRAEAWELVCQNTEGESLRRHMLSVEAAMRAYAHHFGESEEEWGLLGLIHDWDYESGPDPSQHPQRGIELLRQREWPEEILVDIASHAEYLAVPRDTKIRQTLFAVDELCGFIIACARIKGDSLAAVGADTVHKKMKNKGFARGVHREQLLAGAAALGVSFDEHVERVRDALIPIADQLGLQP